MQQGHPLHGQTMPGMQGMPQVVPPQMLGVPGMTGLRAPGLQGGLPGMPGLPGLPGLPQLGGQAAMPQLGGQGIDANSVQAMMQYQRMMQQQSLLMAQQSAMTIQAAQAYDQQSAATVDHEVEELAHNFKLDDRITKDLDVQLKRRKDTFDDDMKALWDILEGARNPAGLLRVKIREMEEGTFRGGGECDNDVQEVGKRYGLDAQACTKLAEVLSKREDRKKDLRQVSKHLELSNKPSSLVMLMLKDLRAGKKVDDPEYPAAVGSYAHKRGLKGSGRRSRSRGKRRRDSDSSSSPPPRRSGAGPLPGGPAKGSGGGDQTARPRTLLEMFG